MSLVEILTLVLLAGILVLLVLIFNNITAARRSLEERDRAGIGAVTSAGAGPSGGYEGAGAATGGYGGGGAAPAATEGYAPAGGYGAGGGGGYGSATPSYETQPSGGYGAGAGSAPQTAEQPSYAGAEPASDYATWSESAPSTGAGTAGATPAQDFPEETPFEREGRWWFKRGDELLIYDEQAGQWVAAPAGTTPGGGSAGQPAGGGAYGYDTGGAAETATAGVGEPGGWRCPSCGAINGASATTCRMCFSARP